jgi:hypothetical protein
MSRFVWLLLVGGLALAPWAAAPPPARAQAYAAGKKPPPK